MEETVPMLIGTEEIALPKHFGCYTYVRTIGKGSSAIVIQALHQKLNEIVACKVVSRQKLKQDGQMVKFEQELRIIEKTDHPNLCKIYDILYFEEIIIVAMEYCQNGDLFDYITTTGKLSSLEVLRISFQLFDVLCYLHSRNIVHRDIKPENIVFSHNMNPKLIDFGISHEINTNNLFKTKSGTFWYFPPEALLGKSYDPFAADIWALGITIFTMVFGCYPWKQTNDADFLKYVTQNQLVVPETCAPNIRMMIRSMLDYDPSKRPTAFQLFHSEMAVKLTSLPNVQKMKRNSYVKTSNEMVKKRGIKNMLSAKQIVFHPKSYIRITANQSRPNALL